MLLCGYPVSAWVSGSTCQTNVFGGSGFSKHSNICEKPYVVSIYCKKLKSLGYSN